MTKDEFAHYAASLAQRAILYEVSTTPKPGLVDRANSGSHKDMDFFTFMASSSALYKGLYSCALIGLEFDEEEDTKLLDRIRKPGIECERAMFEATNGVNTHKGIIFSMGILCAVAGKLFRKKETVRFKIEEVCHEVKSITSGLSQKDFKEAEKKKTLTHGEHLYMEYGFKGIRGEVESGFESIRRNAVKVLRNWGLNRQYSMNDLFLELLLNIMADSQDTNIVSRGGMESLQYVNRLSERFIIEGGMVQPDAIAKLESMNRDFVDRNISPGGSADLLAVTIFLGLLEGILK